MDLGERRRFVFIIVDAVHTSHPHIMGIGISHSFTISLCDVATLDREQFSLSLRRAEHNPKLVCMTDVYWFIEKLSNL
jgi:hypothetical protein